MTETKISLAHLREAQHILNENVPVDNRTVYPKRWAKVMRERGTWDDSRMVKQRDLPVIVFGKRVL
jgi:hypothetical protein